MNLNFFQKQPLPTFESNLLSLMSKPEGATPQEMSESFIKHGLNWSLGVERVRKLEAAGKIKKTEAGNYKTVEKKGAK